VNSQRGHVSATRLGRRIGQWTAWIARYLGFFAKRALHLAEINPQSTEVRKFSTKLLELPSSLPGGAAPAATPLPTSLLEAAELCGADRPRCGQLPAETSGQSKGGRRARGARAGGRRARGARANGSMASSSATTARWRPSRGAANGGRALALRGSGHSSGGERAAGGAWQPRRIDPLPLPLSLPLCLAEEEELQRRAVRRSAASSHRAAEPPVRPPRRRSACATAPRRATRRATAEKNGGGGAAKSTCPTSARAEPPRRCASCPAPCPRTNPTTRRRSWRRTPWP